MLINAYSTHRHAPSPDFARAPIRRRDRSDPELDAHINGFMGFVMDRGKRPMTVMRYAVLRHLERVRYHLSFEVEDVHFDRLSAWASDANALIFTEDGCVRAPDGAVLVDPGSGEPHEGAKMPYPEDAAARKARSEAVIVGHDVPIAPTLPPVIGEVELELRDARDVASRCLALFACAVRAESLASNEPLPVSQIRERLPMAFDALSGREQAFMANEAPGRQDIVDHAWRYEALAVLLWALGTLDTLPFPEAICDVSALAKVVLALDANAWRKSASLRPAAEVLDALDLTFRLHWATTEARSRKTPGPAGVEPGVVSERHYALNWLVHFEDADWDDVTTPT